MPLPTVRLRLPSPAGGSNGPDRSWATGEPSVLRLMTPQLPALGSLRPSLARPCRPGPAGPRGPGVPGFASCALHRRGRELLLASTDPALDVLPGDRAVLDLLARDELGRGRRGGADCERDERARDDGLPHRLLLDRCVPPWPASRLLSDPERQDRTPESGRIRVAARPSDARRPPAAGRPARAPLRRVASVTQAPKSKRRVADPDPVDGAVEAGPRGALRVHARLDVDLLDRRVRVVGDDRLERLEPVHVRCRGRSRRGCRACSTTCSRRPACPRPGRCGRVDGLVDERRPAAGPGGQVQTPAVSSLTSHGEAFAMSSLIERPRGAGARAWRACRRARSARRAARRAGAAPRRSRRRAR